MTTTRVLRVDPLQPDPTALAEAAEVLLRGGLVAFPTETVYGLGAAALDPRAVRGIFAAKERPTTDPVIVHLPDLTGLRQLTDDPPPGLDALAAAFWPGPLTLIVRRGPGVPPEVTAGGDTVAVRVPAHPVARALLLAANVPVAAPSANRFSRPSPTCAEHVLTDLDGRIDLIIDGGPTQVGVESTIVDLTRHPPQVLRPGGVAVEALRGFLPDLEVVARFGAESQAAPAPGQFVRHYAPATPLHVFEGGPATGCLAMIRLAESLLAQGNRIGLLAFAEDLGTLPAGLFELIAPLGPESDPSFAAHRLYAALRTLDAAGLDVLVARLPEPVGLGLALRDRLIRAADGKVHHA